MANRKVLLERHSEFIAFPDDHTRAAPIVQSSRHAARYKSLYLALAL